MVTLDWLCKKSLMEFDSSTEMGANMFSRGAVEAMYGPLTLGSVSRHLRRLAADVPVMAKAVTADVKRIVKERDAQGNE